MNRQMTTFALSLTVCTTFAFASPLSAAESTTNAAAAAGAAATASAPRSQAAQASAKKICLNLAFDTGTRLQRRQCKTRDEWTAEGVEFPTRK